MPNRLLRDWTNSDKMDSLSVQGEVFFTRLIMKADDFGCFWADAKRLKSNLFPLKDSIRETDIPRWLAECQKAGLIVVYESGQKEYLQIIDFGQRLRIHKSKFPKPDINLPTNVRNVPSDDSNPPPEVEEEVEEKGKAPPYLGNVTYDAEQTIKKNPIRYEQILMKTGVQGKLGAEALRKYHLHLEEKEQYPKGKVAVFSGFEKWLMNEKKFTPKTEVETPITTYRKL